MCQRVVKGVPISITQFLKYFPVVKYYGTKRRQLTTLGAPAKTIPLNQPTLFLHEPHVTKHSITKQDTNLFTRHHGCGLSLESYCQRGITPIEMINIFIWLETTINYTMIYYIATMAIVLWSMSLGY